MSNQPILAEAAVRYAAAGWPVHPLHDTVAGHCSCDAGPECQQAGKHPRTAHGFHDATTNPRILSSWWRRWPDANIGIPTGTTSRLAVVDLDGTTGEQSWRALTNQHGHMPTATAITPHGRHHWHRLPEGVTVPRAIRGLGDGVDLLGDDGYAIAPPSKITVPCPKRDGEPCEGRYTWNSPTRGLAPTPAWVPRLLENRQRVDAATAPNGGRAHEGRCEQRRSNAQLCDRCHLRLGCDPPVAPRPEPLIGARHRRPGFPSSEITI